VLTHLISAVEARLRLLGFGLEPPLDRDEGVVHLAWRNIHIYAVQLPVAVTRKATTNRALGH
jgi:hypothetical protein